MTYPCSGHLRTGRQLDAIVLASAEARELLKAGAADRIEAEARAMLRSPRAADIIPDVERDGSRPLIFGLLDPAACRGLRRRPGRWRSPISPAPDVDEAGDLIDRNVTTATERAPLSPEALRRLRRPAVAGRAR